MWTWTPLMESFMSFSWPFQEHFDEISDRAIRKNAFIAPLQLLGKIQKKSIFIFIFGQMIEDQVLFHLSKFGKNIFSLRNFPDPLKWRDEAVPQGAGFGSLKSVWALLDTVYFFLITRPHLPTQHHVTESRSTSSGNNTFHFRITLYDWDRKLVVLTAGRQVDRWAPLGSTSPRLLG